jgi:hypothetical protein
VPHTGPAVYRREPAQIVPVGRADWSRQTLVVLDHGDGGAVAAAEEATRTPDEPDTSDASVTVVERVVPVVAAHVELVAGVVADNDLGDERAARLRAPAMN